MKIFYWLSPYISHRQAGEEYVSCLRQQGHEVVVQPDPDVDIAIIHEDPSNLARIIDLLPWLRSIPLISYAVWENEKLADVYKINLQLANSIWTPSQFSQNSMLEYFPHTHVVPHVVQRVAPSAIDLQFAHEMMQKEEGQVTFFSIVDAINLRKNLKALLAAFARVYLRYGTRVKLVLKQYRAAVDISGVAQVISLFGDYSAGQMAALHVLSDAYVSAHYAEGWGLGLSQSMSYGKPVIATGYSGNMEFMSADNSLPVPYTLVPMSDEMMSMLPLFREDMYWAEVDQEAMVAAMCKVVEGRIPASLPRAAAQITQRFGAASVGRRMDDLLKQQMERWSR